MSKFRQHLTILIVLILALTSTIFLSDLIFIRNTPVIRPNLNSYLALRFAGFKQYVAALFVSPQNTIIIDNVPLKMITKGVYAAKSSKGESYTLYKQNDVEWVEYVFNIKGKEVKINVPKGQLPPPRYSLESVEQ